MSVVKFEMFTRCKQNRSLYILHVFVQIYQGNMYFVRSETPGGGGGGGNSGFSLVPMREQGFWKTPLNAYIDLEKYTLSAYIAMEKYTLNAYIIFFKNTPFYAFLGTFSIQTTPFNALLLA